MISSKCRVFSDNDKEVFEFNDQINSRIKVRPMYFERGMSPFPHLFGRRAVAEGLFKALDMLPSEYGFLIWDVYRPRAVQEKLFNWMREMVRKNFHQLSDAENYEEAKKYASPPSKIGDAHCPPHLSGGAIDLTLYDVVHGKELE